MFQAFFNSLEVVGLNPMLLDPIILNKYEEFKRQQCKAKRSYIKKKPDEEKKKRDRGILYCSALNTGKLKKVNVLKIKEHGIIFDQTAKRFVMTPLKPV